MLSDTEREWMEHHERRVLEDENAEMAALVRGLYALLVRRWPGGGFIANLPRATPPYAGGEEYQDGCWWFLCREQAESAAAYAARVAVEKPA